MLHYRPGEGRDPYAAAKLWTEFVIPAMQSNLHLWVPAYAGTTLSALRSPRIIHPRSRDI
jgi:hypothetical protein